MKLLDTVKLPSGRIFICETEDRKGKPYIIECTEMQDVFHSGNDETALNSTDISVIKEHLVPHSKKWLLTVSTQLGCGFKCKFCDVPLVPFRGNLSFEQIVEQIDLIMAQSPHVESSDKAKIGFARMGEPALNWINVLMAIRYLKSHPWGDFNFLPCYNSIVPNKVIHGASPFELLQEVLSIKENVFNGFLHLQLSINSTDENTRKELFGGADVVPWKKIVEFIDKQKVTDRTITLNFICGEGWEVDVEKLKGLDPKKFAIKLIPLNKTSRGNQYGLKTEANYKNFDVLKEKGEKIRKIGLNVVVDTIAHCEEAGLCCGQLAHIHMQKFNTAKADPF